MVEITQEDFEAYEGVRKSGVTNMMDTQTVSELTEISEAKVRSIIENYGEYKDKFGGEE